MPKPIEKQLTALEKKELQNWIGVAIQVFLRCQSDDDTLLQAFKTRESLREYEGAGREKKFPTSDTSIATLKEALNAIDNGEMVQYNAVLPVLLITDETDIKNVGGVIPTLFIMLRDYIGRAQKLRYDAAVAAAVKQAMATANDAYASITTKHGWPPAVTASKKRVELSIKEALAKEILICEYHRITTNLTLFVPFTRAEMDETKPLLIAMEARLPGFESDLYTMMSAYASILHPLYQRLDTLERPLKAQFHSAKQELIKFMTKGPIGEHMKEAGKLLLETYASKNIGSNGKATQFFKGHSEIAAFIASNKATVDTHLAACDEAKYLLQTTLDDSSIEESCKTEGRRALAAYQTLKSAPIINERVAIAKTFKKLTDDISKEQEKRLTLRATLAEKRIALQMIIEDHRIPITYKTDLIEHLATPGAEAWSSDELLDYDQRLRDDEQMIHEQVAALGETVNNKNTAYTSLQKNLRSLAFSRTLHSDDQVNARTLLAQNEATRLGLQDTPLDEVDRAMDAMIHGMRDELARLQDIGATIQRLSAAFDEEKARLNDLAIAPTTASNPFAFTVPEEIQNRAYALLLSLEPLESPARIETLEARILELNKSYATILTECYQKARETLEMTIEDLRNDDSLKQKGRALLSVSMSAPDRTLIKQAQALLNEATIIQDKNQRMRHEKETNLAAIHEKLSALLANSRVPNEYQATIRKALNSTVSDDSFATLDQTIATKTHCYQEIDNALQDLIKRCEETKLASQTIITKLQQLLTMPSLATALKTSTEELIVQGNQIITTLDNTAANQALGEISSWYEAANNRHQILFEHSQQIEVLKKERQKAIQTLNGFITGPFMDVSIKNQVGEILPNHTSVIPSTIDEFRSQIDVLKTHILSFTKAQEQLNAQQKLTMAKEELRRLKITTPNIDPRLIAEAQELIAEASDESSKTTVLNDHTQRIRMQIERLQKAKQEAEDIEIQKRIAATLKLATENTSQILLGFQQVDAAITEMQNYSKKLTETKTLLRKIDRHARAKGGLVNTLASTLQDKLKAFKAEISADDPRALTPERIMAFKLDFTNTLHAQDKQMSHHRAKWKPIVTNIAIALSALGGLLLAIRWSIHAYQTRKTPDQYKPFEKILFFAKTASQTKIATVERAFNKALPDQNEEAAQGSARKSFS